MVEAMARISSIRGVPRTIRVDNGPRSSRRHLTDGRYENGVTLDFSRPGKPTNNAFVQSFNSRLRDECLSAHWFLSLTDAQTKIEAWRGEYNESRSYTSLGWLTRVEYSAAAEDRDQMNAGNLPLVRMRNRKASDALSGLPFYRSRAVSFISFLLSWRLPLGAGP